MKGRLNLTAVCLIVSLGMANAADNARQDSRFRMTLSPESGDGADANLILSFSTPDHVAPRDARVLINSGTDGRNACFIYYSHAEKEFRLIKNSGAESFSLPLKADGKLENAQCSLDVAHSSADFQDGVLKLELVIHFKSAFDGSRNIYTAMQSANGAESGLQYRGKWRIPHGLFLQGTSQ
jgi:hypothetical protein